MNLKAEENLMQQLTCCPCARAVVMFSDVHGSEGCCPRARAAFAPTDVHEALGF